MLLRAKLKKMARIEKTSLAGLFSRAIFVSVAQVWPEDTYEEIRAKYEKLNILAGKCLRIKAMPTEEQMKPLLRLDDLLTRMEEAANQMNDSNDSVDLSQEEPA